MLVGMRIIIRKKMIILIANKFFQNDVGCFTIFLLLVEIIFDCALFDYYLDFFWMLGWYRRIILEHPSDLY